MIDFEALRKAEAAATPGPLAIDGSDSTNWGLRSISGEQHVVAPIGRLRTPAAERDAALLALARNLYLPLLDVAEAAELVRLHFPMSRESWGPRERALAGALAALAEAVERQP